MSRTVYKIGFWSALTAFCATLAYCIVQILQIIGAVSYPLDEVLIYGTSLCIVIPFLLAILALHHITPGEKKFWSHGALVFSIIYTVFVTANYVVQLATVIPLKVRGGAEEIRILEQTPHSMFWNFDALGYIFMGLATLIAIPLFERKGIQKWVRFFFLSNALVTPLISLVYFYPEFSENLLFIGFPWAITAPGSMLMLALMFKGNGVLNKFKEVQNTKELIKDF